MATGTFSSRILGLVREQLMAAVFGASGITDAFAIAYRIPNMLRDLLAEGVFSSAFVPVFTEATLRSREEARKLLWSLFYLLLLITCTISILMAVFAPEIISFITDDRFTADPDRLNLTVQLVRLMSPFLVIVSIAALFMGVLNTLKVFFVPAVAPALFNVLMITSILVLPPHLEARGFNGIFALGVGVVTGGLAQMLLQFIFILKQGITPTSKIRLWGKHSKTIVSRLGIGTIGVAATQINLLVTTILATGTVAGAVSWLIYAFRLFQFPVGVLSVSMANSNLVHFGRAWKGGDYARAKELLFSSYIFSLLIIAPPAAMLMAMAGESVHIVFERGSFTSYDTEMTATALRYYSLGLLFYAVYKMASPCFFVLDRPRIPVLISVCCIVFNIIFCSILVPQYGFSVLALGTSISMLLNATLQGMFLRRLMELNFGFFFNLRVVKILLAGAACYFTSSLLCERLFPWQGAIWVKVGWFIAVAAMSLVPYILILWLSGEGRKLLGQIKGKNRG